MILELFYVQGHLVGLVDNKDYTADDKLRKMTTTELLLGLHVVAYNLQGSCFLLGMNIIYLK